MCSYRRIANEEDEMRRRVVEQESRSFTEEQGRVLRAAQTLAREEKVQRYFRPANR